MLLHDVTIIYDKLRSDTPATSL